MWVAVLRLGGRLFGWLLQGWGDLLGGSFKAEVEIWVACLGLGVRFLKGCFKAGGESMWVAVSKLFGW